MFFQLPNQPHLKKLTKFGQFISGFIFNLVFFFSLVVTPVEAVNQFFSTVSSESASLQKPELNLNLSPPVTYLSVRPGETKSYQLILQNSGTRNLQVQLQLADFESNNKTGQPIIKLNSKFNFLKPRDKAWGWQNAQLLKSGETAKVWLDITIPDGSLPAEYHLTILAQAEATSESNSSTAANLIGSSGRVTGLVGSNLILAIATDNANQSQISLEDWPIPKFVDSLGEINLQGLVRNFGNQAGPIIGKATLTGPNNKILKSWLLYPDMVLPDSTRAIRVVDVSLDPTADPNSWLNQPNLILENSLIYKPGWLFGNYVFKIQVFKQNFTDAPAKSEKIVQITALPFGILAIILAIPICFWLISLTKNWFAKTIAKSLPNQVKN